MGFVVSQLTSASPSPFMSRACFYEKNSVPLFPISFLPLFFFAFRDLSFRATQLSGALVCYFSSLISPSVSLFSSICFTVRLQRLCVCLFVCLTLVPLFTHKCSAFYQKAVFERNFLGTFCLMMSSIVMGYKRSLFSSLYG